VESPVAGNELPPVAVEQEHLGVGIGSIIARTRVRVLCGAVCRPAVWGGPVLRGVPRLRIVPRPCIVACQGIVTLLVSVVYCGVRVLCGPVFRGVGAVGIAGWFLEVLGFVLGLDRSFASQD
jgi:hypothetical protein